MSLPLASINVHPSFSIEPDTFLVSPGLVHDPGRGHNKASSTDLYPIDEWRNASDRVVTGESVIAAEDGLSVFDVPDDLIEAIAIENNPKNGESGGDPFMLGSAIQNAGSVLVAATLGESYALDPKAVMLRSFPSTGLSTGKTTNGFHFDAGDPRKLRIGVNLGDIPRRVYYVATPKRVILAELGLEQDVDPETYQKIASLALPAIGVKVNPGEGWTLPTVDFLHDGRRAVEDGFSSFVLLSATRTET